MTDIFTTLCHYTNFSARSSPFQGQLMSVKSRNRESESVRHCFDDELLVPVTSQPSSYSFLSLLEDDDRKDILQTQDETHPSSEKSFDSVKCFCCERDVQKGRLSLHLLFGTMRCSKCGTTFSECESFMIWLLDSSMENIPCRHELYFSRDPVAYITRKLVVPSLEYDEREKELATLLENYLENICSLENEIPWKQAIEKCKNHLRFINSRDNSQGNDLESLSEVNITSESLISVKKNQVAKSNKRNADKSASCKTRIVELDRELERKSEGGESCGGQNQNFISATPSCEISNICNGNNYHQSHSKQNTSSTPATASTFNFELCPVAADDQRSKSNLMTPGISSHQQCHCQPSTSKIVSGQQRSPQPSTSFHNDDQEVDPIPSTSGLFNLQPVSHYPSNSWTGNNHITHTFQAMHHNVKTGPVTKFKSRVKRKKTSKRKKTAKPRCSFNTQKNKNVETFVNPLRFVHIPDDDFYYVAKESIEECPYCYEVLNPSCSTVNCMTFIITFICPGCGLYIYIVNEDTKIVLKEENPV